MIFDPYKCVIFITLRHIILKIALKAWESYMQVSDMIFNLSSSKRKRMTIKRLIK